ncbi:MAG: DNA-3-methyladenine glycosylase 2 family protein, partial [Luteimonas sp.]|nr:DNA-3-methyladenine glycosylase 2 family protein [Luteimonas sp.]
AFELAVRAVLGQQVTVAAARTLARRLVERFGTAVATPWTDIGRAFPGPETLAQAPVEHIAELGIIRSRAGAIQAIASKWPELANLFAPGSSPDRLVEQLRELPGIGPWTAHYIAMRALGHPDAFPADDLVLQKAVPLDGSRMSAKALGACAEAWRPWRAYAVIHLWRDSMTTPKPVDPPAAKRVGASDAPIGRTLPAQRQRAA